MSKPTHKKAAKQAVHSEQSQREKDLESAYYKQVNNRVCEQAREREIK